MKEKTIEQKPEEGQNPIWPGEGLQAPGVIDKKTIKQGNATIREETRLPECPNHSVGGP